MVSLRQSAQTVPVLRKDRDGGRQPKQTFSNAAARFRAQGDLVEYDQITSCEVAAATALVFAPHAQVECI